MEIPRYIVIKLEMVGKDTVKATEITDRCEVYEHEADEDKPQKTCHRPNHLACHPEKNERWCGGCEFWYADELRADWNCVTCEHFRNNTEMDTMKCIRCREGSNYEPQTERSE